MVRLAPLPSLALVPRIKNQLLSFVSSLVRTCTILHLRCRNRFRVGFRIPLFSSRHSSCAVARRTLAVRTHLASAATLGHSSRLHTLAESGSQCALCVRSLTIAFSTRIVLTHFRSLISLHFSLRHRFWIPRSAPAAAASSAASLADSMHRNSSASSRTTVEISSWYESRMTSIESVHTETNLSHKCCIELVRMVKHPNLVPDLVSREHGIVYILGAIHFLCLSTCNETTPDCSLRPFVALFVRC